MVNDRFNGRRSLRDIVRGGVGDLQRAWDQTQAAAGLEPLPSAIYRCHVAGAELRASRSNGTPGLNVRFDVLDGEFKGRRVFHDTWITADAMSRAKYELGQLGVTRLDDLEKPLPPGLIADVTVTCRTGDDGLAYNRVRSFKIIPAEVPVDDFAPGAATEDGDASEGHGAMTA